MDCTSRRASALSTASWPSLTVAAAPSAARPEIDGMLVASAPAASADRAKTTSPGMAPSPPAARMGVRCGGSAEPPVRSSIRRRRGTVVTSRTSWVRVARQRGPLASGQWRAADCRVKVGTSERQRASCRGSVRKRTPRLMFSPGGRNGAETPFRRPEPSTEVERRGIHRCRRCRSRGELGAREVILP